LLLWRRRLVGVATAIYVAVAAACCGGSGPTINRCWSVTTFAGVIVTKGEFIVVSCRLMLHDVSNDLHITRRECLLVVAVVAVAVAMLAAVVAAAVAMLAATVVVAWRSGGQCY
jgi:hypothetical protein